MSSVLDGGISIDGGVGGGVGGSIGLFNFFIDNHLIHTQLEDPDFNITNILNFASSEGIFTYSSTDENMCTISSDGTIHLVNTGTASIIITITNASLFPSYNTSPYTFSFVIYSTPSLTIQNIPTSVQFGHADIDIQSNITSINTNGGYTYSSSDQSVCTITASGILHIIATGTSTITVTQAAYNNYNTASTTFTLTVNSSNTVVIGYTSTPLTIQNIPTSVQFGHADIDIQSNITSINTNGGYTYSSSDQSVCTITANGIIHFIAAGTSTITVTQAATNIFNTASTTFTILVLPISTQIASCYAKGTKILCIENGKEVYIPIESMKKDTLVKTYKDINRRVKLIGKKLFVNNPSTWYNCMYTLQNPEYKDLVITGSHSILTDILSVKEQMYSYIYYKKCMKIKDKYLLNAAFSDKFVKDTEIKEYTYYHFVLESDDTLDQYGVWANGILSETMCEKYFKTHNFDTTY